ncbi:WD40 repeat domain-containing protein [Actinomadura sp. KC216]|nr:WD40 repeat domain-containing protein [Actinomadura sp. KC216]TDB89416.1 WD40 repeat domain-containing protein [Actinomadura sp. KC216]
MSGASGVGKSSLLRAGLIPELARGAPQLPESRHWPRLLITPTPEPLRALAEGWARTYGGDAETVHGRLRDDPPQAGPLTPDGRLVLVVDQFEELFTLVSDEEERQAFVRSLHALAEGRPGAAVIIGLRADYWDRCAAYPQFAEAIQDGQVIVGPMTEADLRLAITGPAAAAGLEIDPGLVETILAELRAGRAAGDRYEAGALPLLSQALRNTWDRREGARLTIRGYEESGRVRDSVRRTADDALQGLPAADRKLALRLFRRMTVITAGGRTARRTATLAELHAAASAGSAEQRDRVRELLSAFAARRLLTLHEDTVEIAHEVLLTAWPALRQWLEPDLTAQAVYDRLIQDAAQWAEHHRDPAFLYRGARLLAVDDVRARWDRDPVSFPPPGPTVEGFVAASAREARRAGRRRRLVMTGLAVLAALALAAAGAAVDAANDAERQRDLAVSRQLAAQSKVAGDPVLSALLAVAAWRIAPTPEARHSMLDAAARPGRAVLPGHGGAGAKTEPVFSPDGSIIAAGTDDGVVRLWDTASRWRLPGSIVHPGPGCSAGFDVAFSPDGRLLAVACFATVRFWDVATRRPAGAPLATSDATGMLGSVEAMAFSPDGGILATAGYEGVTRLWDVRTRRKIGKPLGSPDTETGGHAINAVAFTPDGKRLVTAGADDVARLWDTAAQRRVGAAFTGHTDDITDLAISPDGTALATASTDGTARLWSLSTRDETGELREPGEDRGFRGIAFSPDGKRLVTTGAAGSTRLWDTAGRRPVGSVLGDRRVPVHKAAFSPDGRLLAVTDDDGKVWLWDPLLHRQSGTALPAAAEVAFSPDGTTLAAAGPGVRPSAEDADRAVRLWDVATQREIGPRLQPAGALARGNVGAVYEIGFSPDGRTLTTASVGGNVIQWDAATHRQNGPPVYSDRDDWRVKFSPDGRIFAIVFDRSIGFWDIARKRETGPRIALPREADSISEVEFSPDGATLAAATADRTVRLFDVAARRQTGDPLPAATAGSFAQDMAFSPDGKTLATTAGNGTVRLWDIAGGGRLAATLTGHTGLVFALAFSPDGRSLVTGSADRTVRLWDLQTRSQIGPPLTGHTSSVTAVAYSPGGTTVATVGNDGTARLWNVVTSADPAAMTCANAGRSLTRAEWEQYISGEEFQEICP